MLAQSTSLWRMLLDDFCSFFIICIHFLVIIFIISNNESLVCKGLTQSIHVSSALVFAYIKDSCVYPHTYILGLLFPQRSAFILCMLVLISAPYSLHHGEASVTTRVWPVHSRAESGCVCRGWRSAEGGGDALRSPTQWRADSQWLEESKSIGPSTHIWPGECTSTQAMKRFFIVYSIVQKCWAILHFFMFFFQGAEFLAMF